MYCHKPDARKSCLCVSFGMIFLVERRPEQRCRSIEDFGAESALAQSLGFPAQPVEGSAQRKSRNLLSGGKIFPLPRGMQTGSSKAR
jgi:hypothetical protein